MAKVGQKARRGQANVSVIAARFGERDRTFVAGTVLADGTLDELNGRAVGQVRTIDPATGRTTARADVRVGEVTRHVLLLPNADAPPSDSLRAFLDAMLRLPPC
jgi:hypothetical protein